MQPCVLWRHLAALRLQLLVPIWCSTSHARRAWFQVRLFQVQAWRLLVLGLLWRPLLGLESESFNQQTAETFCFGSGAMPLVGTPAEVAEQIAEFRNVGMDGVLMSYMDFLRDTKRFGSEILPLLKKMNAA